MSTGLKKNLKWLIPLIVAIAGAAVGGWYFYQHLYGTFAEVQTKAEVMITEQDPGISAGENTIIFCAPNGVKAYDSNGNVKVDAAFEMEEPFAVARGEYIAVAEYGGKHVQVIPGNGVVYRYDVTYPIVKLAVAKQGVTAAMLDAGNKDIIEVRDKEGEVRVQIGTDTRQDGIPVDMALSPDGKKLVSMYVSFDGDDIVSKVTFYNMDDVGKTYVDNIVGQFKFPKELVWSVRFLGNDTVAVMTATGIKIYAMKEVPKSIAEIKPQGTIVDEIMTDGGIAVVVEKDGEKKLDFYSISGVLEKSVKGIRDYKRMYYNGEEAALLGSQNLRIYRKNGTCKLDMELTQSIDSIYFGEKNKYFLVSPGKIKVVEVK